MARSYGELSLAEWGNAWLRMTERATGTERFERVVLGSLSKVTCRRNWTAVDVTWMRERSGSMSRLRKVLAVADVCGVPLGR